MARIRLLAGSFVTVAARPGLWVTALRQYRRMVPRHWWRVRPFLPVPDRDYLRFRMQTAYGDAEAMPEGADLVTYLRWCRRWPSMR